MNQTKFDPNKFENVHQIGGIRTGTLDTPDAGGGRAARVALVDTGAGLRFTVALDRGGDVVDASYSQYGLAFLTPNGYLPPNVAYHTGLEWLRGWAGGLLTTCGPQTIGGPREQMGETTSLHGRYSNNAAVVEELINPDPHRGRSEYRLALRVRDSRMFGPFVEVRRVIRGTLGVPEILIEDEVFNRGNSRCAHHWLYHINFGYPLLDRGARFVYRGQSEAWALPPAADGSVLRRLDKVAMARLKRVTNPLREHAGSGERGLITRVRPDRRGVCRVGLINDRIQVGVQIEYPAKQLPRLANWQHYGPRGSYVTGLEPFSGSLLGPAHDKDRAAIQQSLAPGQARKYQVRLRVLSGRADLRALAACDGPVTP